MIHEVMVLDHSGPFFGMILYGAALKLFIFAALVVRLALRGAVCDQEEQPKERGNQNSDQDERDPEEDSEDRFHRAVTAESLRGLDVDHQSGGI